MRFSTIHLKLPKSVLLIIAFCLISCTSNQTNLINKDIDFLILQADLHWQQRYLPEQARLAKHFFSKAYSLSKSNINLSSRYIRACYFVSHYIETDAVIKDSIFQEGAKIAMDVIHDSEVFNSISDTTNLTINEIELLTLQNLDSEYVPIIYWWVANIGRYLIPKPIGERLMYADLIYTGLEKLIELNPNYYYGGPYRLLGTFYVRVPGFDIELAKDYFQTSLNTYPNCFSTSLLMAQYSCTKANNREHFHELLENVVNSDPNVIPEITPENKYEQNFAKQLLKMEFLLFE